MTNLPIRPRDVLEGRVASAIEAEKRKWHVAHHY
jgi:hypothetical protein